MEEGAGFCPGCGTQVGEPQQAQQEYSAPPPQPEQQQYAPPPPQPGQQQYAPPPPQPGQQQYAPPPPQPGQQQYAPPPGQQQYGGQQGYTPPPQGQGGANKFKDVFLNTKDESMYIDPADIAQNKMWGGLAYILFFLPLIGAQGSRYGRFHANQGLLFLILWVIIVIIVNILTWVFLFSAWYLFFIPTIISVVLWIFAAVIGIIGLINGFTGKVKELPFIGKFRIIKY
jgi:uncharacterized membrane protein